MILVLEPLMVQCASYSSVPVLSDRRGLYLDHIGAFEAEPDLFLGFLHF